MNLIVEKIHNQKKLEKRKGRQWRPFRWKN